MNENTQPQHWFDYVGIAIAGILVLPFGVILIGQELLSSIRKRITL